MLKIATKKTGWVLFGLCFLALVLIIKYTGQIFFINTTPSIPMGLYIKSGREKLEIGDTVVFTHKRFTGNLIKYVAAIGRDIVCSDEAGTLWINDLPVAQANFEKYLGTLPTKSWCHKVGNREIIALGDHPDSFDSRYFGVIHRDQVVAKVIKLWDIE